MKHSYQTRRLLALRDLRHDGQNVSSGEEVHATEIDARYLIRAGAARDPDERIPEAPHVANQSVVPKRVGRPTKAEVAARAQSLMTSADMGSDADAGRDSRKVHGAGEHNGADAAGESGDQTAA